MAEQPTISSDRVLEILRSDPVGAVHLRAAIAEATCEAWERKYSELESQKAPAATPQSRSRPDDDPPTMSVGHVYPTDPNPQPQPAGGARHAE